jgi:hypothetical protein
VLGLENTRKGSPEERRRLATRDAACATAVLKAGAATGREEAARGRSGTNLRGYEPYNLVLSLRDMATL